MTGLGVIELYALSIVFGFVLALVVRIVLSSFHT